jgi:hypothetical protein
VCVCVCVCVVWKGVSATACITSRAPHPLRSRNSRHLQCCRFWCPRGIPAGRHYRRGTGRGAGGGLPDVHEIASNPHTRFSLQTGGQELSDFSSSSSNFQKHTRLDLPGDWPMSWRAKNRSKDAKTPSVGRDMSKKPELDSCPIQP